jgi:Xaa-Pro aminopeptidase
MWLLNIRGSDVSYNPVIVSYAVITASDAHLFVAQSKISSAVATHLQGVIIHPYDSIEAFLKNLASSGTVLVDPSQINWRLYQVLGDSVKSGVSPITMLKAVKNIQEINGIRNCHIRDGVALTAFLHYLEKTITSNPYGNFTEYDVAEKIEEFRAKISGHVSPSFR